FSSYCSANHRDLHSFPTRRSSDLESISADSHETTKPRNHETRNQFFFVVSWFRDFVVDAGHPGVRAIVRSRAAASHLHQRHRPEDRKSTRLNSSHDQISYAVFCLK